MPKNHNFENPVLNFIGIDNNPMSDAEYASLRLSLNTINPYYSLSEEEDDKSTILKLHNLISYFVDGVILKEEVATELTRAALMVFQAVAVATMVITMSLVTSVTGGVLRRIIQVMHGIASCITVAVPWTGATLARRMVFPSVV